MKRLMLGIILAAGGGGGGGGGLAMPVQAPDPKAAAF